MKIDSSKNQKINRDSLQKDDLSVGLGDSQGLNKELVLLEAGKAFVDGIFNRVKDILHAPGLSEEIKQLKEEVSALKNQLANKEKPKNNNDVISGDDFDENDEDLVNAFEPSTPKILNKHNPRGLIEERRKQKLYIPPICEYYEKWMSEDFEPTNFSSYRKDILEEQVLRAIKDQTAAEKEGYKNHLEHVYATNRSFAFTKMANKKEVIKEIYNNMSQEQYNEWRDAEEAKLESWVKSYKRTGRGKDDLQSNVLFDIIYDTVTQSKDKKEIRGRLEEMFLNYIVEITEDALMDDHFLRQKGDPLLNALHAYGLLSPDFHFINRDNFKFDTYQRQYSSKMALNNENLIAKDVATQLELFEKKDFYGLFKVRLDKKFFDPELSHSLHELDDLARQAIVPANLKKFQEKYAKAEKTIKEKLIMEVYEVTQNDLKKNKDSKKVQEYQKGIQKLLNPDQKQTPDEYIKWRLKNIRYDFDTFCTKVDQDSLLQADKKACSFVEDLKYGWKPRPKDERKALRKLFEEELKKYTPLEWRANPIARTLLQASGVLDCNMKEMATPDKDFNSYLKKVADLVTDGNLSAVKDIVSVTTSVQKYPKEYYKVLELLFDGFDPASSLNPTPEARKVIEEAQLKYKEDLLEKQEKNLNISEDFIKDVAKGKHNAFVKEALKIVKEKYPEKENLKEVEKLLKEISQKGASQTISDNNIDGRSKDAKFIKDMDSKIKQMKEDSLGL
jgi:hypothetical protein